MNHLSVGPHSTNFCHMQQVDAGRRVEHFDGQVKTAADPVRCVVELALVGAGIGGEFLDVARRHRVVQYQQIRVGEQQAHRREGLDRIVGQRFEGVRIAHQCGRGRKE